MRIDKLREMDLPQIKEGYGSFLCEQNMRENTIATSKNDAFYLLKNDDSINFWDLLLSVDFENEAREHLIKTLKKRSKGNVEANINSYMYHIRKFREYALDDGESGTGFVKAKRINQIPEIPKPCKSEVEFYQNQWLCLEKYCAQEEALKKLFFEYAPYNQSLQDILLKATVLNDFYSTNIFSIYEVAKHIHSLKIDERLRQGDPEVVTEIKEVEIKGKRKNIYSFATKYCSHHNPHDYPIYDYYVQHVITYFGNRDGFSKFRSEDLKDYKKFKEILNQFMGFYGLEEYSFKEIDRYLWQLGKKYFRKKK